MTNRFGVNEVLDLTTVRVASDGRSFLWHCPDCFHWNPNRRTSCRRCARALAATELAEYAAASEAAFFQSCNNWFVASKRVAVSEHRAGFRWCCPQCDCWNAHDSPRCADCHKQLTDLEAFEFAESARHVPHEESLFTFDDVKLLARWAPSLALAGLLFSVGSPISVVFGGGWIVVLALSIALRERGL